LDLVDHDQTLDVLECQHRVCQTGEVPGIFEIEECHRLAFPIGKLPSERGFPDLSRSDDADGWKPPKELSNPVEVSKPLNHD
jgi:hypothetical protein